ncbi:MAG: RNA polymerase-associated protein RapA [Desulfobacterales bacterium]|nr:RNA polymerase-associated protein RapA [Desulfobacterales bacterium]
MIAQDKPAAGQRWISETEPELGLGIVVDVKDRQLTVAFPASDTVRCYAAEAAPLRRVRFRVGDRVTDRDGRHLTVDRVTETGGRLTYHGQGGPMAESDLGDRIGFSTPRDRLMLGRPDPSRLFNLRCRTLFQRSRCRRSPILGFSGGRIDLVPHQFHIAAKVTARRAPRVLLSDETGLGKTIEACLILHRLIVTGRVGRVLILVPESLVHQWFVELLRRFNLIFRICDATLCQSVERSAPQANPFEEAQLILSSIEFAADTLHRADQITAAPWDLVIVDEAHHLKATSPAYDLVAALATRTPGLLLLTATPEQLGQASHFARLRLLDPHRYRNLETFVEEAGNYHRIAALAGKIIDNRPLTAPELKRLRSSMADLDARLADPALRGRIIDDLIDRHGVGRVVFRNTRQTVTGFASRKAHLIPLPCEDKNVLAALAAAFTAETTGRAAPGVTDFAADPRVDWLAEFLRSHEEKVLLICRSVPKAAAVHDALTQRIRVKSALFHEDLSLIHRDRNAAWFSEPDGARILICSEIGSEGRNFQFAHHLVLFDLPLDPEQLEQRIGRLDRIGRQDTVHIHVPYLQGSVQEVLARWFHQGLNAFETVLPGGRQILDRFGGRVQNLALGRSDPGQDLTGLIRESTAFQNDLAKRLKQGRDRLLELGSYRPERAGRIVGRVAAADQDPALAQFMTDIFAHFGIEAEALSPTIIRLRPGLDFDEAFSGFRGDEMAVTFDRATALVREDLAFLTWDHPMVTEAMALLLESERGNCALAWWPEEDAPGLILETVYVLECVAPPALHIDRFLPPTAIRVVIDHRLQDCTDQCSPDLLAQGLRNATPSLFLPVRDLLQDLVPQLLEKSRQWAEARVAGRVKDARHTMNDGLEREIQRLQALARVNPDVRPEEIAMAMAEKAALDGEIARSRLRLDALRLIWKGRHPEDGSS